MSKFMSLKVWQRSKDLAVYIYKITGKGKFSKALIAFLCLSVDGATSMPYPLSPKQDTNKNSLTQICKGVRIWQK